jgi:rare lipoprotein A
MLFSFAFSQHSGKATFYHDKYNGRKAADGSTFYQTALTCASNVYKLGSKIRVTNLENRKSVEVKVTDTGPFKLPKIVDLSKAAFSQIASLKQGVIKVLVEEIN